MHPALSTQPTNAIKRLLKKNPTPTAKALHDAWIKDQAWRYGVE